MNFRKDLILEEILFWNCLLPTYFPILGKIAILRAVQKSGTLYVDFVLYGCKISRRATQAKSDRTRTFLRGGETPIPLKAYHKDLQRFREREVSKWKIITQSNIRKWIASQKVAHSSRLKNSCSKKNYKNGRNFTRMSKVLRKFMWNVVFDL